MLSLEVCTSVGRVGIGEGLEGRGFRIYNIPLRFILQYRPPGTGSLESSKRRHSKLRRPPSQRTP